MGEDGRRGAEDLSAAGALILAQNRESSVVWGMPGAIANAGLADQILPPDELALAVRQAVFRGRGNP